MLMNIRDSRYYTPFLLLSEIHILHYSKWGEGTLFSSSALGKWGSWECHIVSLLGNITSSLWNTDVPEPEHTIQKIQKPQWNEFLSFFLSYLQMECRAMKYFPAHISWTTGRKRMLSNEARKYTKISFQICCRTKRFWDRDHVFLWLVYISKEFSMQKAFFPTRCYCCASNAFLPYITVFLTKYMQGSKHAVISLLSKIRSEEGDFWKDWTFVSSARSTVIWTWLFNFPYFSQCNSVCKLPKMSHLNFHTNNVWKLQKMSHSTLRAKRATFVIWLDKSWLKMPKMVYFGDFL